jgi:hypothetical protein
MVRGDEFVMQRLKGTARRQTYLSTIRSSLWAERAACGCKRVNGPASRRLSVGGQRSLSRSPSYMCGCRCHSSLCGHAGCCGIAKATQRTGPRKIQCRERTTSTLGNEIECANSPCCVVGKAMSVPKWRGATRIMRQHGISREIDGVWAVSCRLREDVDVERKQFSVSVRDGESK